MFNTIVTLGAVLVALVALVWTLRFSLNKSGTEIQSLQGDLKQLRESSERLTAEVGNRLDAINRQVGDRLNENATALRSGSKEVNDRIASVQTTFAGLQKQVGEMTEQARQLGELSRSISELQNVLSAPKLRGGFGDLRNRRLPAPRARPTPWPAVRA